LPKLKKDINIKKMVEELEKVEWYHEMKFGNYIAKSYRGFPQEERAVILSKSFKGKSVLDIGCAEGYFGFLAEDEGASKVLMIDNCEMSSRDLAFKYYDTKVEFNLLDIYDLDKLDMQFDVVLFMGLFFHLVYPLYALELVYKKLNIGGELYLEVVITEPKESRAYMKPRLDTTVPWWQCTMNCVFEMLKYAKYKNIEIQSTFEEHKNQYYILYMRK